MFLSTIEFVCGLLIGLVVGHLLHYKTYIQLCNINQKLEIAIQAVELNKIKIKSKSNKLPSARKYADDVENLLKNSLIRNLSRTRTFHLPKWLLKSANYAKKRALLPPL